MNKLLLSIVFSISTIFSFAEQPVDSLWAQGNTAYQNGNYQAAINSYNSILEKGLSAPDLYFNLGNSFYKMNELAQSILFYERAIKLSPSNEDYRYNLDVAKLKVVDKIEIIPQFFLYSWISNLKSLANPNGWAIVAIFLFIVCSSSILLWRFGLSLFLKRAGFLASSLFAILFVVSLLISFSEADRYGTKNEAVILRPVVTVKSSPDQNGKDLFILHEGTKVVITDSLTHWIEVKISDGNSGWVNAADIEKI
ncbi:tetratricopeptide repeat protein [Williamwhitmania taraxaci]|uniref:Tetratricopeptide repeat-containing protein n=1 Tax=Williamwhitmania taraxaci TaxID=1640674 RepID=A0A1G6HVI6_9BACT|nr:tetratricopeptide repeat protein [Williamwhitmania taraxaci]SDB98214.1 Tetratricopeptide repeat-containing protein [Williamwhitmania taraxaci]